MIEILLAAIAGLVLLRIYQARRQHQELINFIDALATMIGEHLDGRRE
ncbi:MAG: hypothetical protein ACYSVY_00125 [Planctomycetota bacterium]|jgi:hypothetical protein